MRVCVCACVCVCVHAPAHACRRAWYVWLMCVSASEHVSVCLNAPVYIQYMFGVPMYGHLQQAHTVHLTLLSNRAHKFSTDRL